jgi:oligopeptide/dipeptide ABC transporter ATP-binding protein
LGERSRSDRKRLEEIKGIVPSLLNLPAGCAFHPRCSHVMDICRHTMPELPEIETGHRVRCWLYISH